MPFHKTLETNQSNGALNTAHTAYECTVREIGSDGIHICIDHRSEVHLHSSSWFHYFDSKTNQRQTIGETFKGGKLLNQDQEKFFQLLKTLPANSPGRSISLESIYKLYPTLKEEEEVR